MVVEVAVLGPGGTAAVQAGEMQRVDMATTAVKAVAVGAEARALAQAWMAVVAVVRTKRSSPPSPPLSHQATYISTRSRGVTLKTRLTTHRTRA